MPNVVNPRNVSSHETLGCIQLLALAAGWCFDRTDSYTLPQSHGRRLASICKVRVVNLGHPSCPCYRPARPSLIAESSSSALVLSYDISKMAAPGSSQCTLPGFDRLCVLCPRSSQIRIGLADLRQRSGRHAPLSSFSNQPEKCGEA